MGEIRVADADELPPGKGKRVEVGERQVTVYNLDGRLVATATRRARGHLPTSGDACAQHGLVFDVHAEDSPARVRDEIEACEVRVRAGGVWLVLPDQP